MCACVCVYVRLRRGDRDTQTGDQGLSVTSCYKYIDKLDGQTELAWEGRGLGGGGGRGETQEQSWAFEVCGSAV